MFTKAWNVKSPCVLIALLASTSATAQSVITGVVKDTSGAVLPGVVVEVSSSALIEGMRSASTDSAGQYRIADVRPGAYVVMFSLGGFDTIRREGVQLPSDFTATINAEMKIGNLQESVTVSGASPIVDVQSTARTQVVTRDTLDAIPTGRSFQAFAALVPSVRMTSLDIGVTSGEEGSNHSVFAQDTWRINRLTLTGGLRWESVQSRVPSQDSPAGRFVPQRSFDAVENVPNWRDLSPRFGAVYDLTGDGQTALKYSLNRYNQWEAMLLAMKYNPLALTTSQLRWTDINGDDIAQGERGCIYRSTGCEIDFSTLPSNFGVRSLSQPRDLERWYTVEHGIEVQHTLSSGLSVSGSFVRGDFRDMPMSYNSLVTPADYTPMQIYNPVDGTPLTIYNLNAAKATSVAIIDTSSSAQKKVFTGYTVSFNARLPHGIRAFGGFNADRVQWNNCGQPDDPNLTRLCDDWQNDLPLQTSLKLSATVPAKWGIVASGSWQNLQGYNTGVDGHATGVPGYGSAFVITRTTRYPTGCPSPCPAGALVAPNLTLPTLTVPLQPYGSVFTERINEVEIRVARTFKHRGVSIEPRLDVFNLLNSDTATAWRSVNYGTSSYLQASAVPPARFAGVGLQIRY